MKSVKMSGTGQMSQFHFETDANHGIRHNPKTKQVNISKLINVFKIKSRSQKHNEFAF